MKPFNIPDFIATNLPRHGPMEAAARLADPKDKFGVNDYVGTCTALIEPPARPDTLLEMYDGGRLVQQDALARPEHYTIRQQEIVAAMSAGREANPPTTIAEKNELMMTYTRTTVADRSRKKMIERITTPADIILDDGRTVTDAAWDERAGANFQNQDFGDEIVII